MKITVKNSPNHYDGRQGWKADMVCFHQTGNTSAYKSISYYMNPNAQCAPNYVIDTNGDVYQLVSPDNAAWANGTATKASDKKFYGYSLSEIVKSRKTNANFYTYSIEFVHCQWGNINDAQVSAAVELIKTVILPHMRKNGITPIIDRAHFVGHSDITPKTRDPERYNCPGKKFPYDEIISRVFGKEPEKAASFAVGDKVTIKDTADTEKKEQTVTLAFDATIRSEPKTSSAKLGLLTAGTKCVIVKGTETKDPKTNYTYVQLAGGKSQWIVKSAIKQ